MLNNFIDEINLFIDTVFSNTDLDKPAIEINRYSSLFDLHKSPSPDQFIDFEKLKKLLTILNSQDSLVRLNHYGFCYQVESQNKEKERLIDIYKNDKSIHLYQEKSNDNNSQWFFIGNLEKWDSTLIELVTVEHTDDPYQDYWFPHVQFDFDTKLNSEQIANLIKDIYGDKIKPFPIIINDITYIMRWRLGVVDGIAIEFDLATNSRNVKSHRDNMLKKIA